MDKEKTPKTPNSKKKPNPFVGIVKNRFKVKGKLYLEGQAYDCGSAFSYNYLKLTNKIK